jgi:hypothetical protein
VTEVRVVWGCPTCRTSWADGRPAACTEPGHEHHRFEIHAHRTVVALPDGTEVTAVSFDADDPYARERRPDFGLYLDHRWAPPWPHTRVDWPDFGVPADPAPVVAALGSLLERARAGETVEVGCLGGHGRTGTALAVLAVLTGHPPADAVGWVRARYCDQAVETAEQADFVAGL